MQSRYGYTALLPLLALLLAGVTLFVYQPGLNGPFLFDDEIHIEKNQQVHIQDLGWHSLLQAWNSSPAPPPSHRPLAQLSFGINHALSGLSPSAFKATNLAIHLLNGLLLYLLGKVLLRSRLLSSGGKVSNARIELFALGVAAVWLLHPLNLSTVLYVVQRMAQLSTLFVLSGLLLYCLGRLRLARGEAGLGFVLLAFPVAGLGLLSKENAALFPLLLLVLELTLLNGLPAGKAQRALRWVRLLGIGLPLLLGLAYLLTHTGLLNYEKRPFDMLERLLTQARALWFYLQLFVIPTPQTMGFMHDDFTISRSLLQPATTLLAILAWLGVVALALWQRRQHAWFAFAVLFFLGAHALESSIFPLEMVFEHRNYLAIAGPAIGLVYLLTIGLRNSQIGRLLPLLGLVLIVFFAAITHLRASDWRSEVALILSEAEHHPRSPRNNFRAAQLYIDMLGKIEQPQLAYQAAREHFETILQLDPGQPNALFGLVVLNLHVSKPPQAAWVDMLEQALRHGDVGPTRLSISQFFYLVRWQRAGDSSLDHALALRLFAAALDNPRLTRPGRAGVYSARRAYYELVLDRPQPALEDARQAARLWPRRWHYHKKHAQLAMQTGHFDEAQQVLRQAMDKGLPQNQQREAQQLLERLQQTRNNRASGYNKQ